MFKLRKDYSEYEYKSLRLPRVLIQEVQHLANINNLSFNKVVIQCIEYSLSHLDDEMPSKNISILYHDKTQV